MKWKHICKELNQYININKNWNNRCNFNIYKEEKIVLYKGCNKNIKLKDKNECWIYIQNEKDSRKIEYRKEIFNEAKYIRP
ncbi:hypothetical protein RhiirA4_486466 [Rhizophagus irregularis]|uniref:Uncharacterized protein n=1 Tax=Rhizophagus irregularis TaxID=588596 RepID=A0A2I1HRG2_9GLOM|nr:hypothetical protein RhiirA4_486466 [Rhizophagus irregularis]